MGKLSSDVADTPASPESIFGITIDGHARQLRLLLSWQNAWWQCYSILPDRLVDIGGQSKNDRQWHIV